MARKLGVAGITSNRTNPGVGGVTGYADPTNMAGMPDPAANTDPAATAEAIAARDKLFTDAGMNSTGSTDTSYTNPMSLYAGDQMMNPNSQWNQAGADLQTVKGGGLAELKAKYMPTAGMGNTMDTPKDTGTFSDDSPKGISAPASMNPRSQGYQDPSTAYAAPTNATQSASASSASTSPLNVVGRSEDGSPLYQRNVDASGKPIYFDPNDPSDSLGVANGNNTINRAGQIRQQINDILHPGFFAGMWQGITGMNKMYEIQKLIHNDPEAAAEWQKYLTEIAASKGDPAALQALQQSRLGAGATNNQAIQDADIQLQLQGAEIYDKQGVAAFDKWVAIAPFHNEQARRDVQQLVLSGDPNADFATRTANAKIGVDTAKAFMDRMTGLHTGSEIVDALAKQIGQAVAGGQLSSAQLDDILDDPNKLAQMAAQRNTDPNTLRAALLQVNTIVKDIQQKQAGTEATTSHLNAETFKIKALTGPEWVKTLAEANNLNSEIANRGQLTPEAQERIYQAGVGRVAQMQKALDAHLMARDKYIKDAISALPKDMMGHPVVPGNVAADMTAFASAKGSEFDRQTQTFAPVIKQNIQNLQNTLDGMYNRLTNFGGHSPTFGPSSGGGGGGQPGSGLPRQNVVIDPATGARYPIITNAQGQRGYMRIVPPNGMTGTPSSSVFVPLQSAAPAPPPTNTNSNRPRTNTTTTSQLPTVRDINWKDADGRPVVIPASMLDQDVLAAYGQGAVDARYGKSSKTAPAAVVPPSGTNKAVGGGPAIADDHKGNYVAQVTNPIDHKLLPLVIPKTQTYQTEDGTQANLDQFIQKVNQHPLIKSGKMPPLTLGRFIGDMSFMINDEVRSGAVQNLNNVGRDAVQATVAFIEDQMYRVQQKIDRDNAQRARPNAILPTAVGRNTPSIQNMVDTYRDNIIPPVGRALTRLGRAAKRQFAGSNLP